jgi:hypothetical protein
VFFSSCEPLSKSKRTPAIAEQPLSPTLPYVCYRASRQDLFITTGGV